MNSSYPAVLSVNKLRLSVRLGEHAAERERPQPVEISLRFYFPELPPACGDDGDLFLCYDKIAQEIINYTCSREFRLIEYLTMEIYALVKEHLAVSLPETLRNDTRIWLMTHKCIPPVPAILGGTSFTYTDLPEGLHAGNV